MAHKPFKTEAEAIDYLRDHLSYEIKMMRMARLRLALQIQTPYTSEEKFKRNAYYECLVLHVRGLFEFLASSGIGDDNVRAIYFTTAFKFAYSNDERKLKSKIHKQIMHLSKKRGPPVQIQFQEAIDLSNTIDTELEKFSALLQPNLKAEWTSLDLELAKVPAVPTMVVTALSPSSTNMITVVST